VLALARDGLSAAQVESILRSADLGTSYGCELLTDDLQVVEDMSADFQGGTVSRVVDADIHGSCQVKVSRELVWGVDLIRPYMRVTDKLTNLSARFNVGVFCLTTPARDAGESPVTYSVQGYDRLYLLKRPAGFTYAANEGQPYLDAVRSVTGYLLDSTAADKVLPSTQVWPLISDQGVGTTTWLSIINDLFAAINYRGVWADENGLFRGTPYVNPRDRAPEFVFDSGTKTVLGAKWTQTKDVWSTPNQWVFVQQNLDPETAPAEGAGIYTVNNFAEGPTSQIARKRTWPVVVQLDAADQSTLVAQGDQRVAADKAISETRKVTTSPFPAVGHADVAIHADPTLGTCKVQTLQWDLDLNGADTQMTFSVVA
jgi:hypothetical protein